MACTTSNEYISETSNGPKWEVAEIHLAALHAVARQRRGTSLPATTAASSISATRPALTKVGTRTLRFANQSKGNGSEPRTSPCRPGRKPTFAWCATRAGRLRRLRPASGGAQDAALCHSASPRPVRFDSILSSLINHNLFFQKYDDHMYMYPSRRG